MTVTDTHLRLTDQQLRPLLPQRTLVPVLKGCLIGSPAALLMAVPEGGQAHALLQVGHPVHSQVDDPGQGACKSQARGQTSWGAIPHIRSLRQHHKQGAKAVGQTRIHNLQHPVWPMQGAGALAGF